MPASFELAHSASPLGPLASGITRMGDTPPCLRAKFDEVVSAYEALVQSDGWPGTPEIISMTGSEGSGLLNQIGGTQTKASAALNFERVAGMWISIVSPCVGSFPLSRTWARMAFNSGTATKFAASLPNSRARVG